MAADSSALAELADRATFVGSPEHKRQPNPLASPRLRTDASDCDEVEPTISHDPARLLRVLRTAISLGQVSGPWEGEFPRYVHGWMRLGGGARGLFRGRLTNRDQGIYKGYFESLDDLGDALYEKLREGGAWWNEIA